MTDNQQQTPQITGDETPATPGRPGTVAYAALAVGVLTVVVFLAANGAPAAGLLSVGTALAGGVLGVIAWRRVDTGADGTRGLPVAITAVALCVGWLLLFALLGRLQYRAFENVCLARQREIGVALDQFRQDHDRYPRDWQELADAGAQGASVTRFTCAARHWLNPRPAQHPYGLNAALLGTSPRLKDPSAVLLTADANGPLLRTVADIARTRHGAWYVAGFVDGHVELRSRRDPVVLGR